MKHDLADGGEICDGPGNAVHDVGVTGLALLAFLGRSPDNKPLARRRVIELHGAGQMWEHSEPDTDGDSITWECG